MFALLPRFVALATELDDLCRHTLASFLLALGLNVERTERNWKIILNGKVASSNKSTRVGFTNLLARPGFSDSLKRELIDMLGGTQAHQDLQLEVENHAMAITQGVELLMQKIVRDGTPTNHLNDEVVQDVEQLEQRIHALGETLRCFSKCYGSEECTRIATASANSGNVLVSPHVEATKGEKHAMTTREELNKVSGIWVPSIRGSVQQIEQIFVLRIRKALADGHVAFMMGQHPRLGARSPLMLLDGLVMGKIARLAFGCAAITPLAVPEDAESARRRAGAWEPTWFGGST
jgi:hypothetical protein